MEKQEQDWQQLTGNCLEDHANIAVAKAVPIPLLFPPSLATLKEE
jgi:hypothetical protein